jgi:ArsR family transcriptional regulator
VKARHQLDLHLDEAQFQCIGRAVSDPRRFAILQQIAAADSLACSALQEHEVISAATISHHLKELSEAGLIYMERCGRTANITFRRDIWQSYCARLAAL